MRPTIRLDLAGRPRSWLAGLSQRLTTAPLLDAQVLWRGRRDTMNRNGIVAALQLMAGWRSRCMYCGDSEGCDIEHYRPKSNAIFREHVFAWSNLLWICQPCNRQKGAAFPVIGETPLLLDPVTDRTWDYFDFVGETGYLVSRSDLGGIASERARATLEETLTRLNHQVVLDERRRSARHLRRASERFLSSAMGPADEEEFVVAGLDAGYPELCEWYFAGRGAIDEPYLDLVRAHPEVVAKLRAAVDKLFPSVWL